MNAERNDRKPIDPTWAWEPFEPQARHPWTLALAGHLFRRAAFGATWKELERALDEGPLRSVDRLLRPEPDTEAFAERFDDYELAASRGDSVDGLRSWWLRRMIETPDPLREKMTLFWHGHFSADASRCKEARTMQRHVALLREHALGSYRTLLEEASRDPALLLTLGHERSRRARPQDGFARALLDAFTVGPDHFAESDVAEAARAFTGYFVLRERFRFVEREHDGGEKRILGKRGSFSGKEAVEVALTHRATPRNIARKIYRYLVSETADPSDALIAPLADLFAKDHDVGALVERILKSNLFFSEHALRQRIKDPVELAVGTVRAFEGTVATKALARDLDRLGMSLLHPPTEKGWIGGRHWIDRVRLGRRHALTVALLSTGGRYGGKLDPEGLCARNGRGDVAQVFLRSLLLHDDSGEAAAAAGSARSAAHSLVILSEYQLA